MKKMKYIAPQIEVIRFDTEAVLNDVLDISIPEVPETGWVPFGGNSVKPVNND